jgi:hypothetical protein
VQVGRPIVEELVARRAEERAKQLYEEQKAPELAASSMMIPSTPRT